MHTCSYTSTSPCTIKCMHTRMTRAHTSAHIFCSLCHNLATSSEATRASSVVLKSRSLMHTSIAGTCWAQALHMRGRSRHASNAVRLLLAAPPATCRSRIGQVPLRRRSGSTRAPLARNSCAMHGRRSRATRAPLPRERAAPAQFARNTRARARRSRTCRCSGAIVKMCLGGNSL